ncbi:MAG: acyl-[ACP]--phospholipid O-acyltransferase [Alphaproteobacteria bacterium]|nr:acyl-[ACP]--phospholipid O-acyltransferase [Alphaproteobacteria bacterium]
MTSDLTSVLFKRRFWPLFVSQFLGAANDNLFKNAMAILVIYRLSEQSPIAPQILVTLAAGIFILPFFLFSATAGQIADRFEKSFLIRIIKFAEILVACLGAWALLIPSVVGMVCVLFLLGVQAAFFGPLKYAIIPEQLEENELVSGNAAIEGGTFLAILLGTIAGGVLILQNGGTVIIAVLVICLAALGFAASLFLPKAHPGNASVRINPNFAGETLHVLGMIRRQRAIFLSVLGISWFWLVGATYLSQFPAFAKDVLNADEQAVTLMLTIFSVGIGIGSMICTRLLKGEISARFVPFAALAMALFAFDLWLTSRAMTAGGTNAIRPLLDFLGDFSSWRVLADLLLLAIAGGIYIVPLYTILQSRSLESERARIIGANNIVNAAFMVLAAGASAAMLSMGFSVPEVFLTIAAATLVVAVYICGLLPDAFLKGVFSWLLSRLYGVEVKGIENLKSIGNKAVIVVNHVSFLDAVLMAAFLPMKPTFAINSFIARLWWVKPFLSVVDAYPMDPTNPMSTKGLIHAVQEGRSCVIFPEGRITVTGALMKIYEGPGMIADKAQAPIVPVRIDGAQFTPFSRLKGKIKLRWFPHITITILPPCRFDLPEEIKGRARRQKVGVALYDVMSRMMFETTNSQRTLFESLLDAKRTHGGDALACEDINRKPLSYDRLIIGAIALGRRICEGTAQGEALGLMLPNSNAAAAAFFAAQSQARVPAMLNFSTGAANVLSACETASVKTVITSRRFIEQARLGVLAEALEAKVRLIYLEDVKDAMGLSDKFYGLLASLFARKIVKRQDISPQAPAVILFTSGSEGTPKGVVLSHVNLLANLSQIAARVAFSSTDIVFNALPIFHSFGLTGGMLLPILSGIKTFLYPSPLHYRIVPEMVYDTNATIMFGTDTFLAGYARVASPYDFYSVRYIFAGAEKVKDETRRIWMEKFGVRILEGYGATETAPVIAVNTPMHFKAGTVGRILPGIDYRLEQMPGVPEGGRLWVKGPNIMLGYYRAEKPGLLEPLNDGWYDTGDIVSIDELGFVRILGRAKRFAKIAGEMISLGKVEGEIAALWPQQHHAVIALPDERKGEQLILITENQSAARDAILAHFRAQGLSELMAPKAILKVDRLPILGTGKTDYLGVKALAEAFVSPATDGEN